MSERLRKAHEELTRDLPMAHLAAAMTGIYDCRAATLWLDTGSLPDGLWAEDFDEAGELVELGTDEHGRFATVAGLRAPETLRNDVAGTRTLRHIAMTRHIERIAVRSDWQLWPRGSHVPRLTAIRTLLKGDPERPRAGIEAERLTGGGWRAPRHLTVWKSWNAANDGVICDVDPRTAETCEWLARTAIAHLVEKGREDR